ncbi:hypothetical protein JTB14_011473 [Gonioctena quinquepunctata]|nr:hypothetical protein JTB14_011473 [Gonioctena quinquepunctata]
MSSVIISCVLFIYPSTATDSVGVLLSGTVCTSYKKIISKTYWVWGIGKPTSSEVLTSYIKQCNEPPWTSYFVKYSSIRDDQWGKSHFNWNVGNSNYHILRTGCFPYIKYHCTKRQVQSLIVEDYFFRIIKVSNLGLPCLAYGVAAIFLIKHTEMTQPVVNEDTNIQASDIPPGAKKGDDDDADVLATPQNNPIIHGQKRRAFNPPELQEASRKMNTALNTLNSALTSKQSAKEVDQCDLFCRMLPKQIAEYPKLEREEIMYEIHGVMMNRRRRYNSMMQSRSYTVSSPSQVVLSRPSTKQQCVFINTITEFCI